MHGLSLGMNWPDIAVKPKLVALLDDALGFLSADHHNAARIQQPVKFSPHLCQPPNGRNRARLMMWRWISDVPSQIRSMRASRHMRSSGNSSIRPIPP